MAFTEQLKRARTQRLDAEAALNRAISNELQDNSKLASEQRTADKEIARLTEELNQAKRVELEAEDHDHAVQGARQAIPPQDNSEGGTRGRISVGNEEPVYRPDVGLSFFRDVANSRQDPSAQERLRRHQAATLDRLAETRDVTTADPGAVGFVPPIYLGEQWAEMPRASRPFADVLPKMPLPDAGMTLSIPRVTTGTTVAVQTAEAAAVSETDIDTESLSVPVRTIAGQNDVSMQALERTFPGLDFLIFQDLRADYDEQLDTQLLAGTGANGQHLGIRAVTSINTVVYTDGSPTGPELLPKLYDGLQKVASTRFRNADTIVMHPRRAAWLGKELSATFPLFQQGQLTQAIGQQDGGFVQAFAGLRVVLDANISTENGASTDEDEAYIVHSPDLILAEGPLRVRVFDDVLSGTLQVRLQVVAYSALISGRQPKSICKLSGTGFKTPTF